MKNKKYLKAAKLMIRVKEKHDIHYGCCVALDAVHQSDEYFHYIFQPKYESRRDAYFGDLNDENILARSLALLLMYEMGEEIYYV
jgi:hypothetical protein